MLKKLYTLFAVAFLSLGIMLTATNTAFAANGDNVPKILSDSEDFQICAENEQYELNVICHGKRAGEFSIKSKNSGTVWYSNPLDRDLSEKGLQTNSEAGSQFIVTVYSDYTGTTSNFNSLRGTAFGRDVSVKAVGNTVTISYKVDKTILVDLVIELNSKGFTVNTDFGKIKQSKAEIITEFDLLPYFSCANYGEDGYLFVPDGSGALIYNNTANRTALPYSRPVFGEDLAFQSFTKAVEPKTIAMPVFGAKNDRGGYFAIIEDGFTGAKIEAVSAYSDALYNRAYSNFTIVGDDRITLGESGSGFTATQYKYDYEKPIIKKAKVSYLLMESGKDYNEMVRLYRDYLGLESKKINAKPSLFLELYGGIKKTKSILGIPMNLTSELTTVNQAKEITDYFKDFGIADIVVSYRNVDTAILQGKIQNKFRINRSFGSKKELNELKNKLDGNLFLENNIFSAKRGGNGFSVFSDVAARINRNNITRYKYSIATTSIDSEMKEDFVIKSNKLSKIYDKYFKSLDKAGFKSAFVNLCNTAYSDFDKDGYISREKTLKTFKSIIEKNGKSGLLYTPNSYCFPYGEYYVDIPTSSSGYDVINVDIPFYQMVLSGKKEYSTDSLNLYSDSRVSFLKALETGSSIKYTFVYDNIRDIKNTEYDYLFGADYSTRKDEALNFQKELEKIYSEIGSRIIKCHTIISDNVRMTEFDNGSGIIVNYSDKETATEYGTVKPFNYLVVAVR